MIELLANGMAPGEAARLAGISRHTVYRRWRTPQFRSKVEQCRQDRFDQAAGALNGMLRAATAAIHRAVVNDSAEISLKAARAAIELVVRLDELGRLQREVADLRQALEQLQRRGEGPLCGLRIIPMVNRGNNDAQK